jgi:branched-chain amino acid transport system substrate-binding protein
VGAEHHPPGHQELPSGPFANVGDQGLKTTQFVVDHINAKGGVLGKKLEIVPFDHKGQPSEALVNLQKMADEGIQIMPSCGPSNVVRAILGGVDKHNERNPNRRIFFLNCGGLVPELTNEQCSFWQVRTSMHAGQQAEIMIRAMPKTVKAVYLINQDYLFGQSAQRDLKKFLAQLRPDVKIVGEELIPLGKIKDFSSYIAKIKASGADGVVTGNWGADLSLLVKAGMEAGLPVNYYTMLGHLAGSPTAIGPGGDGRVFSVLSMHENVGNETNNAELEAWVQEFRKKFDFDFIFGDRRTGLELLAAAITKAGGTDPVKLALAFEGLTIKDAAGNDVTIRKDDHQIAMTYYAAVFQRGVKNDSERTGLGWKTQAVVWPGELDASHTCKMKRPAG